MHLTSPLAIQGREGLEYANMVQIFIRKEKNYAPKHVCFKEGYFRENEYWVHGEEEGKISNGMDMGTRKRNTKEHREGKKRNYLITRVP